MILKQLSIKRVLTDAFDEKLALGRPKQTHTVHCLKLCSKCVMIVSPFNDICVLVYLVCMYSLFLKSL